jgi:hypothetical protein
MYSAEFQAAIFNSLNVVVLGRTRLNSRENEMMIDFKLVHVALLYKEAGDPYKISEASLPMKGEGGPR